MTIEVPDLEFLVLVLLSPFIGSFLGVLAVRLPDGRDVVFGRSVCNHCGHVLSALDLVPVASWLWLRGRCRHCCKPIGGFLPLIELSAVGVVLWSATVTSGLALIASSILGWVLLVLSFIDWRLYLLPDRLTYPLVLAGLVADYLLDKAHFTDHLIGATAGLLLFCGVAYTYRRAMDRDGLGIGDAKLLGALGAWVSWTGLPTIVLLAALSALATIVVLKRLGKQAFENDRIPFGPFLAASGWLVWLYGPLTLS